MSPQSLLFTADGAPADLVRAGEPRLRRSSYRPRVAAPATVTRPNTAMVLRQLTGLPVVGL